MRLLILFLFPVLLAAQTRKITFPDTEDHLVLVVDLHTHSVFSDGSVWPDIRVEEAVRDGLDALAFTEHLEYQPHAHDLPHPDRNRAHELGEALARPHDLIIIPGAEITRSMPPGHANALFIDDANALLKDDALEAFREAKRQGAFVFWNHPNWIAQRKDGVATLTDMHRKLIAEDMLHGIEVVNDLTISKEALAIALENDLAIMGTSDIHGLVDWQFKVAEGGHRPVTLVLATERSSAAIEAALHAGRTVAWFENTLVGRPEHLGPVVRAAISVEMAAYHGPSSVLEVVLRNDSDCAFLLDNRSGYSLQSHLGHIRLAPHAQTSLMIMTGQQREEVPLTFRVLNAVTAPEERLELSFSVKPE